MGKKKVRICRRTYYVYRQNPQSRLAAEAQAAKEPVKMEVEAPAPPPTVEERPAPAPAAPVAKQALYPSSVAIIYRSELDFVSRCILDYPNIETGGQMFGYWTDDGTPVVLYTIGPGPHANHQPTFFNQDISYLQSVGNVLVQKYGLQHMGEWHSHHKLGLAHPSGHDASSMAHGIASSERNRFLLCIGNYSNATTTMLNPFNFVNGRGTSYVDARWVVKQMDSPFRAMIDAELRSMLYLPEARKGNYVGMDTFTGSHHSAGIKAVFDNEYWLANKANNMVLKSMMDFLHEDPAVSELKPLMDADKHVHLKFVFDRKYDTTISFPNGFPNIPPEFKLTQRDWMGRETRRDLQLPQWEYNGDIYESFVNYYKNITIS